MSFAKLVLQHYLETLPRRAGELVGFYGGVVWSVGYDRRAPDVVGVLAEASVRTAELIGVGVHVQLFDWLLTGHRHRGLLADEWAFAKTYYPPAMLSRVRVDTGAQLTAGRLQIAYVLGYVIKCHREPSLPLLVHELKHVEQFERWGWAYVAKALWSQTRGGGYGYALATPPTDLNAEQAAARVEDDARARLGLAPKYSRWG